MSKTVVPSALTGYISSSASTSPAPLQVPTSVTNPPTTPPPSGLLATAANPTQATPAKYDAAQLGTPTSWNVTPEQTAQGQLKGILNSGSPLMQQAATQGNETANARGLLNSSIAAGASENAMIANATPIASQDATIHSNAAGYNANTANDFSKANVTATNAANATNAAATNAVNAQNTSNALSAQGTVYKANQDATLAAINNQSGLTQQQLTQYAGITQQFNNDLTQIQLSQTMTQQAKDFAANQLYAGYKAQLSALSAVGSIPDVSTLLAPPATGLTKPAPGYIAAPAQPAPQPAPSSGKVICSYYHWKGYMERSIFESDQAYGQLLPRDFMEWYHSWALPTVDLLDRSETLTRICWPLVNCWSQEMAYRMKVVPKGSIIGKTVMLIGDIAYKIGRISWQIQQKFSV